MYTNSIQFRENQVKIQWCIPRNRTIGPQIMKVENVTGTIRGATQFFRTSEADLTAILSRQFVGQFARGSSSSYELSILVDDLQSGRGI
jgi:hypothetical protein